MEDIKISVIVPIHGVDKYLEECLNSLLYQTFSKRYEVICVSDSPNDTSPSIIDRFVSLRPDIFVRLDVNNKNLSFTRNDGLKKARGEYVAFVDGDDFVDKNYLLNLYNSAEESRADVVCCNYFMYKNGKTSKFISSFLAPNKLISSKKALKMLMNDIGIRSYAWLKLVKRSFLINSKIEFIDNKKVIEDFVFSYMIFAKANKIMCINDRLYFCRQREESITGSGATFSFVQSFLSGYAIAKLYSYANNIKFKLPIFIKLYFLWYMYLTTKKGDNELDKKVVFHQIFKQFWLIANEVVYQNTPWEDVAKIALNNMEISESIRVTKTEIFNIK